MKLIKCIESEKSTGNYELTVEIERVRSRHVGDIQGEAYKVKRTYVGKGLSYRNRDTGKRVNIKEAEELEAFLWKWQYDNEPVNPLAWLEVILLDEGLCSSHEEIRRLVKGGGLKLLVGKDKTYTLTEEDFKG